MSSHPALSIIVPFYNTGPLISKCLDSILSQSFQDFELILVNDGSTDQTLEICKRYIEIDQRIKLINKENGGQGSARNMALDIANGEFISFVDSDDWIDSEMYEIMIASMLLHDCDISICGYSVFRKENASPKSLNPHENVKFFDNFQLMKEYVSTNNISGGPCNKIYKRSLFQGLRFPSLRAREDSYLMPLLLGRSQKSVHVARNFYNWFLREGSTERSSFNANKLAGIKSVIHLQEFIGENYPSLYKYVALRLPHERINLMKDIIGTSGPKLYIETFDDLRSELREDVLRLQNLEGIERADLKELNFVVNNKKLFIAKTCLINVCKKIVKKIIYR